MENRRTIDFSLHPELLSKQLGTDMYRAAEALKQLVANALDADSSRVDVRIHFNELDAPERVLISDDGVGISPSEMEDAFGPVGVHVRRTGPARELIGFRGIGRFAVFALAVESRWQTIARSPGGTVQQMWAMVPGRRAIEIVEKSVADAPTGTSIDMTLRHRDDVKKLFSSVKSVKRVLFNSFAAYLARYEDEVEIWVNDEPVRLGEFVDERLDEEIHGQGELPDASLHHMVLGQQVEQVAPNLLVFATKGTTVSHEVLGDEGIPGKKYLGLVDSAYLSDLTNTAKSELAEFDPGFQALKGEASNRAKRFIAQRQGDHAKAFLERARRQPYYPYKSPAQSPVDRYRRQLYDGVLLTLEEQYRIGSAPNNQQKLIFALARQLLQSEDLASVLTSVLGLQGEEVARFASLLRRTSLSSIIAVADLLVDRLRFLDELEVLVYGSPAKWVKERSQLHKIIEGHTWVFGEQFHLMGSDRTISKLLLDAASALGPEDSQDLIDVDPRLRDIPDLHLERSQWNEGAKFYQHLVVELKRPSVKVGISHVAKLHRYAEQIVESPVWGQKANSHRFTFVLVSAEISKAVTKSYQAGEELGLLSRPSLQHPTELWALRWSDYLDSRREELKFLEKEIEITADPDLLEYLRERVGEYLPDQLGEAEAKIEVVP
jgi:hypothetical protein